MTRLTLLFLLKNKGAQLFLIWVIFWISIWKLSWVFRGKIDVSMENIFWLPKSAQLARSAQTEENSHSFFNVSYTWYKSLYQGNLELPWVRYKLSWPHCILIQEQTDQAYLLTLYYIFSSGGFMILSECKWSNKFRQNGFAD